jgi:hypothetical protein
MVSSYVGKAKVNKHRWAYVVAWPIDRVAVIMGDRSDHCVRAYKHYLGMDQ